MQDARTRWAIAVIALIGLLGSGIALYGSHHPAAPPVVITTPPVTPAISPIPPEVGVGGHPAPATKLYVHVAGAVRKPSLYALAPGSRVMQAVQAAGGATNQADLDAVNLAEGVQDGEKIYIPTKARHTHAAVANSPGETVSAPADMPQHRPGNVLSHVSVYPHSPNDPQPAAAQTPAVSTDSPNGITVIRGSAVTMGGTKAAGAKPGSGHTSAPGKLHSASDGQVNVNTATAEQLEQLPGIGPGMAARILAYRQQAGSFQKVDDLMEVPGIGPKKFAKISAFVTVR